jgi:DNA-binding transcriptional ArsR family regulator
LLEDELDGCCDADVDERLAELTELERETAVDHVYEDVAVLSTLGNETRFTLARLLVAADEELCVCELAPLVDVSESAISHALSDLTEAGLVDRRKAGKWRYYRATTRAHAIIQAIDETRGDR